MNKDNDNNVLVENVFPPKRARFTLHGAEDARIECGLRKKDFADMAGVSLKTLDNAEAGKAMTGPTAFKIYNALVKAYRVAGIEFSWRKSDFVRVSTISRPLHRE